MTACLTDENCQGIYDNGCDNEAHRIYLCPTSATYKDSAKASCIYQKNKYGKYFKSSDFLKKLLQFFVTLV